jgi:hypothetical protein
VPSTVTAAGFASVAGTRLKQPLLKQPGKARPTGSLSGKIAIVSIVLVAGVIFGTLMATTDFSGSGNRGTATTSSSSDPKSLFQQSFDASFQGSCRNSAMRGGRITQDTADRYCDCALTAFHETHSMTKAFERCKTYVLR